MIIIEINSDPFKLENRYLELFTFLKDYHEESENIILLEPLPVDKEVLLNTLKYYDSGEIKENNETIIPVLNFLNFIGNEALLKKLLKKLKIYQMGEEIIRIIEKYSRYWDWSAILRNPNITIDIIEKYSDR